MDRLRGQASSVNHRQTRWGPHEREWSDDAFVKTQLRLRHGLAWILTVSWAERKLQDGSVRMVKKLLHRHTGVLARVYVHFCGERSMH